MSWKGRYAHKLIALEDAAAKVKDGDVVQIAIGTTTPKGLCAALAARKGQVKDVTITHSLQSGLYDFFEPEGTAAFNVKTAFSLSAQARQAMVERRTDFLVLDAWNNVRPPSSREDSYMPSDVFLVQVSPPDENGFVSFGEMVWYNPHHVEHAKLVIAEVNERLIRTYGRNGVHIDQIDFLVEHPSPAAALMRQVPEESVATAQVIGAQVAGLIEDGDCLQIGFGLISGATAVFLEDKNDLGFHSEIVPASVLPLVRNGNMNGRRKTLHPGKMIATALFADPADLEWCHMNPLIELYECTYTNNPAVIAQNERQVAINNALAVDLTGQVSAESFGPVEFSGPGGQLDFVIGAMLSKGGKSITVMPATAKGGQMSRIVPLLELGTTVTVPRTWVDYVVTEYGIASLNGKTQRERAEALIAIAAPEFQEELRAEARRLYWP